jgi:cholesterol transport system auxiliary component
MSAHRRSALFVSAFLALMLPLTGCGSVLPKREPLQVIAPQVRVAPDPAWPQVGWQLAIGRPSATDMIDSRRMVVFPSPGLIQVYKGMAWDASVPDIVQTALVEAFEDSGKIAAVGRQSGGLRVDYVLQMDLRDYQAVVHDPKGPPTVTITISARLVDASSSRAVASRTFHEEATAAAASAAAVASAFDSALGAATRDMVGWTLAAAPPSLPADRRR